MSTLCITAIYTCMCNVIHDPRNFSDSLSDDRMSILMINESRPVVEKKMSGIPLSRDFQYIHNVTSER